MSTTPIPDGATPAATQWQELTLRYLPRVRDALAASIFPFWDRTLDEKHGGVFNCWNNAGTQRISREKFSWSQGRFLWLWSRRAIVTARGWLPGDAGRLLAHARKTAEFLQEHAFLEDGRCVYLLSEDGRPKEAFPGAGLAPSIYADCFVAMGLAEFARASGDGNALERACLLLENIERRIGAGGFPTHPYPIPIGHDAFAVAMIHLNVALVVRDACAALQSARLAATEARVATAAAAVLERFMQADGRFAEFRNPAAATAETLLTRHVTPGHALEGLWMLMSAAHGLGRADWLGRAIGSVNFAFQRGWDELHGGLLLYTDADGGPPKGVRGDSAYERHILATWDTKLWWVHSEAIYASLLCHRLTGDDASRRWFERVWDYTFRVFPQPNASIGEWIQIRTRDGAPLDRVVALPVKDPYHVGRNLLQALQLFSTPGLAAPLP